MPLSKKQKTAIDHLIQARWMDVKYDEDVKSHASVAFVGKSSVFTPEDAGTLGLEHRIMPDGKMKVVKSDEKNAEIFNLIREAGYDPTYVMPI